MQSSFNTSHVNTTQIFSSPAAPISSPIPKNIQAPPMQQQKQPELECRKICLNRLKYVLFVSAFIQYLLIMVYSLCTLNFGYMHPFKWIREFFSIFMSPLSVVNVIYGISTLNKLLKEKTYCPTRISKFMNSIVHELLVAVLNIFIGLFTAQMFMRSLGDDYKFLTDKSNKLNEKYAFLLLAGVFMRFYFYFNEPSTEAFAFPIIHQSKLQQLLKELSSVIRKSFAKSAMPTVHFIAFHIVFGNSFSLLLNKIFFLQINEDETGFLRNLMIVCDLRLVIYAWLMGALILSNIQLLTKLINIFATQPKQFSIAATDELTISRTLEINKFQLTKHLAAQDLNLLANSANGARRKEYYALSVPGSHPHNWKQLVKVILSIVDKFTSDLLTNVDYVAKNRRNDNTLNVLNNPLQKFYDQKVSTREFNEINGIRSLFVNSSPTKPVTIEDEKRSKFLMSLKQKLLRNKLIAFLFGEEESGKLNFLLSQSSQIIIWLVEAIAAIVAKSLEEDNYGVVQHDIKAILKSLVKLKAALEKVSAINTIAKDRNLFALKMSVRRGLYRICVNFSPYFEDMLIEGEEAAALQGFITFKEL